MPFSFLFVGRIASRVKGQLPSNTALPAIQRQSREKYHAARPQAPLTSARPDWIGSALL
tara:strand:+ start:1010 stop:1186 length:177 start_codon:yes stop_codon:yes gene_type:complete